MSVDSVIRALVFACLVMTPVRGLAEVVEFRTVIEQSPTASVLMGEQLEQSRARQYPFYITMQVPDTSEGVNLAAEFSDSDGEPLAGFIYHVAGERILETNSISYATIDDGTPEERMQYVFQVIANQVYPWLEPPPDAEVLGGRKITVGGNPAVEFISIYTRESDRGLLAGRIVGVIPPSGPNVLIFVQETALDRLGITDINELPETFGGRILSSLVLVSGRNENGVMVPF